MRRHVMTVAVVVALAIAFAASSAIAETTLYGRARVSIDYISSDVDPNPEDLKTSAWQVHDNSSRIGIKGSEDLIWHLIVSPLRILKQ